MRRFVLAYVAALSVLFAVAVAGGVVLFDATGPSDAIEAAADAHGYDIVTWEVRNFPEKWLYKLGHLFDHRSRGEEDAALSRYFALTDRIANLERDAPSSPDLKAAQDERDGIETEVEDIIEGRMTDILKAQGLTIGPPPFTDMKLVFPPVDFKLAAPPRVLAVSPRGKIELDRSYLLNPGLSLDTVLKIEQDTEAGNTASGGVSTLVVNSGGLATYPSVVSDEDSYDGVIDTAFHEWTHQYLVFFPLGSSYFGSDETRTLNESVANLSGHELAKLYFERYGTLESSPSPAPSPMPPPAPTASPAAAFDFTKEMRALHQQVVDMLARGQVIQAETLMNQKRDDFQQHGYFIRRLNQAYFAFFGSYADTPGSIDPIGPKLQTLLDRAGSPGEFLRRARAITSRADLDALLAGA